MDPEREGARRRVGWMLVGGGVLIGLAIGLALFVAPAPSGGLGRTPVSVAAAAVGSPAPDFELATPEGETVRLSRLRGRVVILNFWATWCGPCRLEMPDLEARAIAHADRLTVLGINFDETPEEVVAFRDELGVTFPLLLDPGAKVQRLYRVLGYPTTYFVDEQGIIREHHIGLMSPEQIDEYLEAIGLTS